MNQEELSPTPMQAARKSLHYAIEQYGNACKDGNEAIQIQMVHEVKNAIGMLILEAQLAAIQKAKQ